MVARDLTAESQDLPDRKYSYSFDERMHGYMLKTFAPHMKGEWALELGCYRGHYTRLLCDTGVKVDVVEGSMENAIMAMQAAPDATFLVTRFEDFKPIRKYDQIHLIHTLEHMDDPVGLLARCRDWLTPEGRLFVAVPNAFAASRQIAVKMGFIDDPWAVTAGERAHGHRRTYDSTSLVYAAVQAGLEHVEHGGIVFKGLANFQMDAALAAGIIDERYLDGCYEIGLEYPDLCSSIYVICRREP